MHIKGLWRYPVKSLAGEALDQADITRNGITGDRIVHVRGDRGPLTGRTRSQLLTLRARTGPDGQPTVEGHPWRSPEAAGLVRHHGGQDARLVSFTGGERFDVLPLLVATDGAVREFGHDVRRLRPNLLIGGVPELSERDWPGHALRIGSVVIGIHSLRGRCVVTTIDPDSGAQDLDVFRHIRRRFDGELALNCWVIEPGQVAVGDPVELITAKAQPADIGGWIVGAPYHVDEPPFAARP